MHGMGLCINVDIYLALMFYAWPFSHNKAVPISIKDNKYFLSLNINTTLFYCGAGNSDKNLTIRFINMKKMK